MEPKTNKKNSEESGVEIDMSKMSEGKRAALEMTEAAREKKWERPSFLSNLFMGNSQFRFIHPFPEASQYKDNEDYQKNRQRFFENLESVLENYVNAEIIDQNKEIPPLVIEKLSEIGAMGMKIPTEFGGAGLNQSDYLRAMIMVGSHCTNTASFLSVHQSVGIPGPVMLFGNDEQKRKYLPRVARGEISAFALTEKNVGSDPAKMETTATLSEDGSHYVINGEKLWCTNGPIAKIMIVTAKTAPKIVKGKSKDQITAFIFETNAPGFEVQHRSSFMGLNGIVNGVLKFNNVVIPKENVLGKEGMGLKIALTVLNTGRLSIASMCVGLSKRTVQIAKEWCNDREQWGATIGKHAAVADKAAQMAASTFAMEAMINLTAAMVDQKKYDYRLESAMCKMWITEKNWENINHCVQIRGGRGFETAASLLARGETPYPVERFIRDNRITTIFEGSSEIMRLLIAREALDPHIKAAGDAINSTKPWMLRLKAALKAGFFYAGWYPTLFFYGKSHAKDLHPTLLKNLRSLDSYSKKLAKTLFHQMAKYGPELESKQILVGRIVDIAAELFASLCSISYAQHLLNKENDHAVIELTNLVVKNSKFKVDRLFWEIAHHHDDLAYDLAQNLMENKFQILEKGAVKEPSKRILEKSREGVDLFMGGDFSLHQKNSETQLGEKQ